MKINERVGGVGWDVRSRILFLSSLRGSVLKRRSPQFDNPSRVGGRRRISRIPTRQTRRIGAERKEMRANLPSRESEGGATAAREAWAAWLPTAIPRRSACRPGKKHRDWVSRFNCRLGACAGAPSGPSIGVKALDDTEKNRCSSPPCSSVARRECVPESAFRPSRLPRGVAERQERRARCTRRAAAVADLCGRGW